MSRLLKDRSDWSVSMYVPTDWKEAQRGITAARRQLQLAESELEALGVDASEALLGPIRQLLGNRETWATAGGLAFFMGDGFTESRILHRTPEARTVVCRGFFVRPFLTEAMDRTGRFHLLALSQNTVRLFEGTAEGLSEKKLPPKTPTSLEEALQYDDPERQLQFHTGTGERRGGGERAAVFHGHGGGADFDHKDNILRFCQMVEQGVRRVLKGDTAPLLLAGVEPVLSLYREANHYPHLLKKAATGGVDRISHPEELFERATPIVRSVTNDSETERGKAFKNLLGTGKTARDLGDVLKAAQEGRIDTLFLVDGAGPWGRYDQDEQEATIREGEREPGDEDLIDRAARWTLNKKGTALVTDDEEILGPEGVAARFRY